MDLAGPTDEVVPSLPYDWAGAVDRCGSWAGSLDRQTPKNRYGAIVKWLRRLPLKQQSVGSNPRGVTIEFAVISSQNRLKLGDGNAAR